MPSPSVGNLLSDIRVARRPCKPFACPAGVTDKRRWISRSAGATSDWNLASSDLTSNVNELENGPSATGANIDGFAFHTPQEFAEGKHMSISKIRDMDVVTDACAVSSWVVSPKYRESLTLAGRSIQYERNDMRLGDVTLSNLTIGIGSGSIEISERKPVH